LSLFREERFYRVSALASAGDCVDAGGAGIGGDIMGEGMSHFFLRTSASDSAAFAAFSAAVANFSALRAAFSASFASGAFEASVA
jgi:hypothetical protein